MSRGFLFLVETEDGKNETTKTTGSNRSNGATKSTKSTGTIKSIDSTKSNRATGATVTTGRW